MRLWSVYLLLGALLTGTMGAEAAPRTAIIVLDGSASFDPDGTIVLYEWYLKGVLVATGIKPTIRPKAGTHVITLMVTDNEGATDTDEVIYIVVRDKGKRPRKSK